MPTSTESRSSLLTLALAGAALLIGLAVVIWVAGLLAHILGLLVQVAAVAAVGAFVWHRVSRSLRRRDDF